jgi:general secretion pathway protein D
VLAGLLTTEASGDRRGIPGLSRVPLAGGVFRNRQQRERQTELLILLRPRTVQQAFPGDADASSEQHRHIQSAPRAEGVRP